MNSIIAKLFAALNGLIATLIVIASYMVFSAMHPEIIHNRAEAQTLGVIIGVLFAVTVCGISAVLISTEQNAGRIARQLGAQTSGGNDGLDKWDTLVAVDTDFFAAREAIKPYGVAALEELKVRYSHLDNKQYLLPLTHFLEDKWWERNTLGNSTFERIWKADNGWIAILRDGRALLVTVAEHRLYRTLDALLTAHPSDRSHWLEVSDIHGKKEFAAAGKEALEFLRNSAVKHSLPF